MSASFKSKTKTAQKWLCGALKPRQRREDNNIASSYPSLTSIRQLQTSNHQFQTYIHQYQTSDYQSQTSIHQY